MHGMTGRPACGRTYIQSGAVLSRLTAADNRRVAKSAHQRRVALVSTSKLTLTLNSCFFMSRFLADQRL